MKQRVLYVDGFNFFYRAFSKDTQSTNQDGIPIGGVITFMRQLFSVINETKPTNVLIVFDGDSAGERRRKIFKNYKDRRGRRVGREIKTDYANFSNEDFQVSLLFKLLGYFPFLICKVDFLEADDIIAFLVKKNKENFYNIISSSDKDYYQLVDENIHIWSPEKKILITKNNFKEQFKILPENFIYYKILNGDLSDNINGVKGLGEDRILKYIPQLNENIIENLDSLYDIINNIKEDKTKTLKTLKESKDLISRNYKLMKLGDDEFYTEKHIRNIKEQLDSQFGFHQSLLITFSYINKNKYNLYFKNSNYITNIIKNISTKIKFNI